MMNIQNIKRFSKQVAYKELKEVPHFGTEDEIFINKISNNEEGYEKTDNTTIITCAKDLTPNIKAYHNDDMIWVPQGLFDISNSASEISTYPQKIRENCIDTIIDSIKIGRNLIYDIGKTIHKEDALIKGWSTHYNIDLVKGKKSEEILRIKPILDYLLFHPWSKNLTKNYTNKRINMYDYRLHLAGDFLLDYNQINAGISFFIAHMYGKNKVKDELFDNEKYLNINSKEILTNGLNAKLFSSRSQIKYGKILFKDYLEYEYNRLKADIRFFGGENSIKIIEDYLNGIEKTSIEKYKDEPKTISEKKWFAYEQHSKFYEIKNIENIIHTPEINKIMYKHIKQKSLLEIDWHYLITKDDIRTTFDKILTY